MYICSCIIKIIISNTIDYPICSSAELVSSWYDLGLKRLPLAIIDWLRR